MSQLLVSISIILSNNSYYETVSWFPLDTLYPLIPKENHIMLKIGAYG